ncbi:MAG: GGDEF domain-containing protein [Planctomycetes bacterium]|nr:GGDEF domain-containing protein [Planctomycetota bacterium]
MNLHDRLRRTSRLTVAALGVIGVALIAAADKALGEGIGVHVFYLLPISIAAFYGRGEAGVTVSVFGAIASFWTEPPPADPVARFWETTMRLGTYTVLSLALSRLREALDHEQVLSRTDPLTGAANRRAFYELLERESRRAHRQGGPLTLAYIDLDRFKLVNDRFGHAAGDEVLRTVADAIAPSIRAADTLSRLGGDEFAILFPDTDAGPADAALRKIDRVLSEAMAKGGWPVTFSIGLATFLHPPLSAFDMIRKADELMYAAKLGGRARIQAATIAE